MIRTCAYALLVSCAAAPEPRPDGTPASSTSSAPATAETVDLPPPVVVTATAVASATEAVAIVPASAQHPGLMNPARASQRAPDAFTVSFGTTAGPLTFSCERKNAPIGADRLFSLINIGFFKDVTFFRVVTTPRPFVIQFGIHAEPRVNAVWRHQKIAADPVVLSNTKGTLTFAQAGQPDTRTTQLFINLADNKGLDKMGFTPICTLSGQPEVNDTTLSRVFAQHGDKPTSQQEKIQTEGNAFLNREFPNLDFIIDATTNPSAR